MTSLHRIYDSLVYRGHAWLAGFGDYTSADQQQGIEWMSSQLEEFRFIWEAALANDLSRYNSRPSVGDQSPHMIRYPSPPHLY